MNDFSTKFFAGVVLLGLFRATAVQAPAQIAQPHKTSNPSGSASAEVKEVVKAFCGMEAKGYQLSATGWQRMTPFLASPQKQPTRVIVVREFEVGEPVVDNNHATVFVEYIDLGEIDTSGRFYPASKSPRSGPIKVLSEYKLSLVSKQAGATAEAGWKIDGAGMRTFITVGTAIEYLSNLNSSTDDQNTKERAARVLAYFRRVASGR